jgi:hypothetical protein
MASIRVAGAPATMATSRRPIEQGWTPPPVVCRHWLRGFLLCASACLGLLLVVMPISAC